MVVGQTVQEPDQQTALNTVSVATEAEARFEQAFTREVLLGERLRLTLVAVVIAFILVRGLVLWLLFPELVEQQTGGALHLSMLLGVWSAALAYELVALFMVNRALRGGWRPPTLVRYLNATIETSVPTLTLLLGVEVSSPALALALPPTWGYFLFILLAILRLDFWLCAFTGVVAGVQYAALAAYFLGQPQTMALDPALVAPMQHSIRVLLLVAAGVLAGVISLRIRRQFLHTLRSIEDRNRVISMFGQHVSPAVVDKLLSQDVELAGEVRHVCVMFLDIQGFTTYAERRSPEEVVAYLNRLFTFMIDAVNRNHGIVNKFLGDGFMAVFGAPIADERDCRNAVAASLEMLSAVREMSERGDIEPTTIRIGLHAGEAVTGNVGSSARKEYTIIGDVVNLASRLEQLNKQFGSRLLVSETVLARLDGLAVPATPHDGVLVKGREQPVRVYELA